MSFDLPSKSNNVDHDMQQFLMAEQQKAQIQQQLHALTDVCWEKCMDKPRDKLDYRTESCISNCVERFMDTTKAIGVRLQQKYKDM